MEQIKNFNTTTGLTDYEISMIKNIMKKYNINVKYIEKIRSVYKIKTEDKFLCLKKMKHGKMKPVNGNILVQELKKNKFNNVPMYIKTNNNKLFVKYKGFIFYLIEWIDGEECRMKNLDEAVNCAKLLGEFHLATSKIENKKLYNIKDDSRKWDKVFIKYLNDIKRYEKIIDKKDIVSEFDILYKENISYFYNQGIFAFNLLNKSHYNKLISSKEKTICHDSYYYQNIIKKNDDYYIVDLDSIIINLKIYDLGKMISRLMYSSHYKWNFNKAKILIEAYNSVNKLSYEEMETMLAYIVFPRKFWKLGKKRYVKNKNWIENKYIHKLKRIIELKGKEKKFVEEYRIYLYDFI
ncbi:CotS family spore coat protein [Clostridium pasteurianum]|uniref:CotS family spore coat protein n=1 Tax=Clostridium pasteurianum TaxID=1501 RepID=UPI002260E104|nr:CotS family spore coat protein [Clostridium pasteurianum]UZW16187.1 CotS family spore coat protein [Clostridium pasteurianum]